jgi:enoyl-CoA hydratase/carnithine racemase
VWIAAIDGPCGGGGLELSTFFDLRVATPDARFMLPELTVGLTTTFGGQRLARLVGPSRALGLMLEARAITAADAAAGGLVEHVVDGDVVARAQALAARYARRPRPVVAAQKAVFNDTVPLSESLTREAVAQIVGLSTPTTRAALRCWLDRQDPSGDSTFLTDLQPFRDGTALDLNPRRAARGPSKYSSVWPMASTETVPYPLKTLLT